MRDSQTYRKKHPVIKNKKSGLSRKEYLKQYAIKNRDRKREQAKLAMRKKRLLDKKK